MTSGLRLGSAALTTRGFDEQAFEDVGNVNLVWVVVGGNLIWMAHQYCFSVVDLHLLWVGHFVHSDHLPSIACPQDLMQSAKKHLEMILLLF